MYSLRTLRCLDVVWAGDAQMPPLRRLQLLPTLLHYCAEAFAQGPHFE